MRFRFWIRGYTPRSAMLFERGPKPKFACGFAGKWDQPRAPTPSSRICISQNFSDRLARAAHSD